MQARHVLFALLIIVVAALVATEIVSAQARGRETPSPAPAS